MDPLRAHMATTCAHCTFAGEWPCDFWAAALPHGTTAHHDYINLLLVVSQLHPCHFKMVQHIMRCYPEWLQTGHVTSSKHSLPTGATRHGLRFVFCRLGITQLELTLLVGTKRPFIFLCLVTSVVVSMVVAKLTPPWAWKSTDKQQWHKNRAIHACRTFIFFSPVAVVNRQFYRKRLTWSQRRKMSCSTEFHPLSNPPILPAFCPFQTHIWFHNIFVMLFHFLLDASRYN